MFFQEEIPLSVSHGHNTDFNKLVNLCLFPYSNPCRSSPVYPHAEKTQKTPKNDQTLRKFGLLR